MTVQPTISVVVVAHDRVEFVADALDSLASQDLDPAFFEVVLCTNLPRSSIGSRLDASRVTVLELPPGNWGEWILSALPRCRGDVLCFLDDDDWFEPAKLSRVRSAFERYPSVGYFHNRIRRAFQGSSPTRGQNALALGNSEGPGLGLVEDRKKDQRLLDRLFWSGGGFNLSAMAVRRDLVRSLGPLTSELEVGHALALFYAAALGAWDIYFEPEALTRYRVHSANSSTPFGSDVRTEFRRAVERGGTVVRDSQRIARWIEAAGHGRYSSEAVRSVGGRTRLLASLGLPGLSRASLFHALVDYLSLTPGRVVADQRGLMAAVALGLLSPRRAAAWLRQG